MDPIELKTHDSTRVLIAPPDAFPSHGSAEWSDRGSIGIVEYKSHRCNMFSMASIQKTAFEIRRRHHAGFATAKKLVAIECDAVIEPVAQKRRNDQGHAQNGPGPGKITNNTQDGGGFEIDMPRFNEDHRVKIFQRLAAPLEQFLAGLRLQGSQPQTGVFIAANEKLHQSIAQIAN